MEKKKEEFLKLLKKYKVRKKVLEAYEKVNQEDFFDDILSSKFYTEQPVPTGKGHYSDPPLSLARMLHYLEPKKSWRVLEIGTGSGYSTAILSELVQEVYTIEFEEELARAAKERFDRLGVRNVRLFAGDGFYLDSDLGNFDAIIIYAACQKRPLPLMGRLEEGGRLVFPMGPAYRQQITVVKNTDDEDGESIFPTEFKEFCEFPPASGPFGLDINRYQLADLD